MSLKTLWKEEKKINEERQRKKEKKSLILKMSLWFSIKLSSELPAHWEKENCYIKYSSFFVKGGNEF